jgi:hypothetical protein
MRELLHSLCGIYYNTPSFYSELCHIKFSNCLLLEIYTHRTLGEALYIKVKHTNTYVNARIHAEIIVNAYMQHIQEIPININIVINHTHDKSIKLNIEILMQDVNLSQI